MERRAFFLILLICLMAFHSGCSPIPESKVQDAFEPVENFFVSTIRRFNDSWAFMEEEFELAERAGEKAIEERIQERIEDTVDKVRGEFGQ